MKRVTFQKKKEKEREREREVRRYRKEEKNMAHPFIISCCFCVTEINTLKNFIPNS